MTHSKHSIQYLGNVFPAEIRFCGKKLIETFFEVHYLFKRRKTFLSQEKKTSFGQETNFATKRNFLSDVFFRIFVTSRYQSNLWYKKRKLYHICLRCCFRETFEKHSSAENTYSRKKFTKSRYIFSRRFSRKVPDSYSR